MIHSYTFGISVDQELNWAWLYVRHMLNPLIISLTLLLIWTVKKEGKYLICQGICLGVPFKTWSPKGMIPKHLFFLFFLFLHAPLFQTEYGNDTHILDKAQVSVSMSFELFWRMNNLVFKSHELAQRCLPCLGAFLPFLVFISCFTPTWFSPSVNKGGGIDKWVRLRRKCGQHRKKPKEQKGAHFRGHLGAVSCPLLFSVLLPFLFSGEDLLNFSSIFCSKKIILPKNPPLGCATKNN